MAYRWLIINTGFLGFLFFFSPTDYQVKQKEFHRILQSWVVRFDCISCLCGMENETFGVFMRYITGNWKPARLVSVPVCHKVKLCPVPHSASEQYEEVARGKKLFCAPSKIHLFALWARAPLCSHAMVPLTHMAFGIHGEAFPQLLNLMPPMA